MKQFDPKLLRFCIVGALGFLMDTGVLLILTRLWALGYMSARILSFLMACCLTWLLNRVFTFRSQSGLAGLASYMAATSIGALINLTVYKFVIDHVGPSASGRVLGVAIGSVIALGFNYAACRWYVFR